MRRSAFVVSLALLTGCVHSFLEDEALVEIHRDLVYAEIDGKPLRLDLYMPRSRVMGERPPIVLWLHGGSWMFGSHHDCRIDWLAEDGFAVASIEYRTSVEAKWPAQLRDTQAALSWIRAKADTYGYSHDRVAAAGMSSGGHLALMLALDGDDQPVDAVVSYYGPTDLKEMASEYVFADWPGFPVRFLLGASVKEEPERAIGASPAYHIRADAPPVLLIHGEDDFIVPSTQSAHFHEAYLQANLESQLVIVADAGHYGGNRYFGPKGPRAQVVEFLQRHLVPNR